MLRWLLSALVFVGLMTVVITSAIAAYHHASDGFMLWLSGVLIGAAAAGLTCYLRPESFSSPESLRAALRRLEAGE